MAKHLMGLDSISVRPQAPSSPYHVKVIETPLFSGLELYKDDQLIDSEDPRFLEGFPTSLTVDDSGHKSSIAVIFGLGTGALLAKMRALHPTTHYIVVDNSPERVSAIVKAKDCRHLFEDKQLSFCLGEKVADFFGPFFHILSNRDILLKAKSIAWIAHPVMNALHPGFFQALQKQWLAAAEVAKNMQSTADDGYEGFKNTVGNRHWIEKSLGLSALTQIFKGRSGLVVSTGPSLTRSLPYLKQLQDRVILLAADASLKILLAHGIVPHFVFCLERDEGSKPFFQNLSVPHPAPLLVSFPLVPQSVIGAYAGPSLCIYRNYGYSAYLESECPRGIIRCGPSVAHMALVVGSHLGLRRIALVGQDLSYDPDTLASHPEGIAYEGWDKGLSQDALKTKLASQNDTLLFVPGNLRKEVPTCGTYEIFRQVFSEHLSHLPCSVINATMGGAQIPGMTWQSLESLTSEWLQSETAPSTMDSPAFFATLQALLSRSPDPQLLRFQRLRQDLLLWKKALTQSLTQSETRSSAHTLLETKRRWERDESFSSVIFHFLGRDRIQLEWDLSKAAPPHGSDAQADVHIHLATQWHHRCLQIIDRLLEILA